MRVPLSLADLADATGLTGGFGDVLHALRQRQPGHDPGRVAVELRLDAVELRLDIATP
jgi:hypothetical protein